MNALEGQPVSRFSSAPVFSIVVPYAGDDPAFESSLLSVLENKPPACEVLVVHDGSYADPFALGDEVRFVVAGGRSLPAMMLQAAAQAQGRILQVVAGGHCATKGWTEGIFSCFDQDEVGAVVPLTLTADRKKVCDFGWSQTNSKLYQPIGIGQRDASDRDQARIAGGPLLSTFWRTELLRAVGQLPHANDPIFASVLWTFVANSCGMHAVGNLDSRMLAHSLPNASSVSLATIRRIQALVTVVGDTSDLGFSPLGFVAATLHPSRWSELWGRLTATSGTRFLRSGLKERFPSAVEALRDSMTETSVRRTIPMGTSSSAPTISVGKRAA